MKKKSPTDEISNSSSKKNILSKLLLSFFTLLLLTVIGLLGYSSYKQANQLKDNNKKLADAKISLDTASADAISLNEEIESLKSALADYSSYLSEDDLTESDDFIQNPANETEDSVSQNETSNSLSYQKKYKQLYVSEKDTHQGRVVHLTFDDGPSQNTPKVLDILDKYNIKATFFVVYNDEAPACDYYKEIVKRGHTLAIHTASHNYKQIYASVDAYLDDFNKIYTYVYEQTGVRPTLFRYPGGSTNCLSYQAGPAIMEEMERRGFIYYDWNVSSGDGGNQATRSSIYEWVTSKAVKLDESVVLMHDSGGKGETVAALPSVIETLQDSGCIFEPLTSSNKPVQFQSSKKKN